MNPLRLQLQRLPLAMHLHTALIAIVAVVTCGHPIYSKEPEEDAKPAIEATSPDGQFAFRYTTDSDSEKKTYDLISKKSGKVLATVAKSDSDMGPSARFNMHVLWKPDSKAFALTATLWKRGSGVEVYLRDGATFRHIEVPELEADIPKKVMGGKEFPHIVELNSQTAKHWNKDGSLAMEIRNTQDGNGGSITAIRTVELGFDKSAKAKILKSKIKFQQRDE